MPSIVPYREHRAYRMKVSQPVHVGRPSTYRIIGLVSRHAEEDRLSQLNILTCEVNILYFACNGRVAKHISP